MTEQEKQGKRAVYVTNDNFTLIDELVKKGIISKNIKSLEGQVNEAIMLGHAALTTKGE